VKTGLGLLTYCIGDPKVTWI